MRPPRDSELCKHTSFLVIPCGKCPECMAAYRRDWRFRAYQEYSRSVAHACGYESTATNILPRTRLYPSNLFITFTISNEFLERKLDPVVYWRSFKDRFRKAYPGTRFPSYICVPEYGDAVRFSGRLHFHAELFDVPPYITNEELRRIWHFGHIFVGSYFDLSSVWYSTKYIQKTFTPGQYRCMSDWAPDGFKPRIFASNNFGLGLFDDYLNELDFARNVPLLFNLGGYRYPLPRYYTRHISSTQAKQHLYLRMYSGRTYHYAGREYSLLDIRDYISAVRVNNPLPPDMTPSDPYYSLRNSQPLEFMTFL